MLVGQSQWEYILIRASIYFFSYFALGCLNYVVIVLILSRGQGISHPFNILVLVIGIIESLWYLVWYLPFKARLQRPGIKPQPLNRTQRRALLSKALEYLPDMEQYIRKWFLGAHMEDIRRDNVKDWLLWALFDRYGQVGEDNAELEDYITDVEDRLEGTIKKGRGDANPLRLSFDPVQMAHRSLLYYMIIGFLDTIASITLLAQGFKFYRQPRFTFSRVFPFRPLTLLSPNESAAPQISYFVRPHTSRTHRPILFFHGVGIGLITYLPFFSSLPKDVGILAVEFMPISSRICPEALSASDMCTGINTVLTQQGWRDVVFVGHSYGTMFAAPLLLRPGVREKISSVVLIDPVSVLLHLPNVAYNFSRRKPKTANEWQIWYYAAMEPMVAHTLARRFVWHEHMLWPEEGLMQGRRLSVVVGAKDCVANAQAVASYIYYRDLNYSEQDVSEWKRTPEKWTGTGLTELVWLEGLDHGQAMLKSRGRAVVKNVVDTYSRTEGPPVGDQERGEVVTKMPSYKGVRYSVSVYDKEDGEDRDKDDDIKTRVGEETVAGG